jgi:hypothetical protein
LAALLLTLQDPTVTITVSDADGGKPIFARVVLKNGAGEVVDSTGYKTLNGHFVAPDGWKVSLPKGKYSIHADAGFEFFALDEEWTFDGAAEKKIELKRWIPLRKMGWYGGGDHNHLNRDGAKDKNYGKTPVTMEFAASLHASRGWSFYSAGGGGPWIVDGNRQELHGGRRTQPAADAWNKKYGDHLRLGWNNEAIKGRFGHVWVLGAAMEGLTYPYGDKPADAWWSNYDDSWDPWQTGDKSKPLGPYKSSEWANAPVFDCIKSWRDRGILSVYAHPTRTFMIGKNRVSNIAAEFPYDLLAGAPVGGLAIMGDAPDHPADQALWFAALNEGFQVPGLAENDTVYGSPDIRSGPHVTYAFVPEMGPSIDLGKIVEAIGAGRVFASSGAFCLVSLDDKSRMGETVVDDGKEHALSLHAWASADPNDTIDRLEVIAGGKVLRSVDAARGKREWQGSVPIRTDAAKWAIVKVVCKNKSAAAITSPIYFRKPGEAKTPEPVKAAVAGKVTRDGKGVPAEIAVTLWGKDVARTKAGADGAYRLEAPLAAHLKFSHEGGTAEKVILWDDPEYRAIHFAIYSTSHVGRPGMLSDCLPPDLFDRLRARAKAVTIDAELGK